MASSPLAFTHVNLIPMDEERILFDQTVIVQSECIAEIGQADSVTVPRDAR